MQNLTTEDMKNIYERAMEYSRIKFRTAGDNLILQQDGKFDTVDFDYENGNDYYGEFTIEDLNQDFEVLREKIEAERIEAEKLNEKKKLQAIRNAKRNAKLAEKRKKETEKKKRYKEFLKMKAEFEG